MQQPGLKDKCDHENELQTRARTMDYSLSVPPLMHEYLDAVQSWKDFSYYEHPVVKGTWSAVIVCTRRLLEDLISGPDFPKHVQMLGDMIIEDLGSGSLWSVVSRAVLESGFPTNLIREEIDQQQRVVSAAMKASLFSAVRFAPDTWSRAKSRVLDSVMKSAFDGDDDGDDLSHRIHTMHGAAILIQRWWRYVSSDPRRSACQRRIRRL